MATKLTASQENYLELIFGLSQAEPVRVGEIARVAGVQLPSVTKAIGKLAEAGLLRHESYGKVEITQKGQEAARSVVRRDDCLSRLLTEVLALPEARAADEVCRLEHVISQEMLLRLEALVDHACEKKSARWLRGLQEKIETLNPETKAIRVGDNYPHVTVKQSTKTKKLKLRRTS